MARSASLPISSDPTCFSRRSAYAALMVDAVIASAGVMRSCVQASDSIIGILSVGQFPRRGVLLQAKMKIASRQKCRDSVRSCQGANILDVNLLEMVAAGRL